MTYYSVLGVGPECRASRRQKIITKLETWAGPSLQNLCLHVYRRQGQNTPVQKYKWILIFVSFQLKIM